MSFRRKPTITTLPVVSQIKSSSNTKSIHHFNSNDKQTTCEIGWLSQTKDFVRILLFGLLGGILGYLLGQNMSGNNNNNNNNNNIDLNNEKSCNSDNSLTRESCGKSKIWEQIHFVGENVKQLESIDSVLDCCAACKSIENCIAISFISINSSCMLFFDHLSEHSLRKSWTSSISMVENDIVPTPVHSQESVLWNVFDTYKFALEKNNVKPSFRLEYVYRDSIGKRKERNDYKNDVKTRLIKLGMVEQKKNNRDDDDNFTLLWGLHWKKDSMNRFFALKSNQMVNMIPGASSQIWGDKDVLHKTVEQFEMESGIKIFEEFIPKSILVEEGNNLYMNDDDDNGVWMVKQLNSWSGDGVKVVDGKKGIMETITKSSSFILQRYILNPLTLNGFKFDTRWWALISSTKPLRVYVVPNGYIREGSIRYSKDPSQFSNRCMHITNGKVQKACSKKRLGSIKSMLDPQFENSLFDSNGKRIYHIKTNELVSKTKQTIVKSILIGQNKMIDLYTKYCKHVGKCFQLLSFDIIYDENEKVWVEEINTNGFLGGGIHNLNHDYLLDMFQLIGVNGYDRSPYQSKLERQVKLIDDWHLKTSPLTMNIIQNTIDELYHRGSWELVYPSSLLSNDDDNMKLFNTVVENEKWHIILKQLIYNLRIQ